MVSTTNALIVYHLCLKLNREIQQGNAEVLVNLRKILRIKEYVPNSANELCGLLLTTTYLPMQKYDGDRKGITADLVKRMGATDITTTHDQLQGSFEKFLAEQFGF